MSTFRIDSPFTPQGDQPEAIRQLVEGVHDGTEHQVLLGAVSYTHLTLPTILLV